MNTPDATPAGEVLPQVPSNVLRHWEELRVHYINATPRQRLGTIVDRLHDPLHWGPNLLVTGISAVEAFARCLVVELRARKEKRRKADVYKVVRERNAVDLVLDYLRLQNLGEAAEVFGLGRWRSFCQAVTKYRHLLVHECTYLNGGKLLELNVASREVLAILVERAGYKERYERLVAEAARTYKGMSAPA